MNYPGDNPDRMGWVVQWLAMFMAFGVTFVATPQLHGATLDWAVGYMRDYYGPWMAAIGWFFWWIIVAALTFLSSTLLFMTAIMFGRLAIGMIGGGRGR